MPDLSLQHRFELITAPAAEPITVTDAKKQMRIEHSDDDALIARLINVAIGFVDVRGALGKAMITQTWGEWLAPNPSVVYLSLGPVQSVSAIKYYDTDNALQTATLSNFHILGTSGRTLVSPKTGYAWPTTPIMSLKWSIWLRMRNIFISKTQTTAKILSEITAGARIKKRTVVI